MSNVISPADDVTNGADRLMKRLLTEAEGSADVDFAVSVMAAATRYLAVKNRLNAPDEANAFDQWRGDGDGQRGPDQLSGSFGSDTLASLGGLVGGSHPAEAPAKRKAPVSTRASRAARRAIKTNGAGHTSAR